MFGFFFHSPSVFHFHELSPCCTIMLFTLGISIMRCIIKASSIYITYSLAPFILIPKLSSQRALNANFYWWWQSGNYIQKVIFLWLKRNAVKIINGIGLYCIWRAKQIFFVLFCNQVKLWMERLMLDFSMTFSTRHLHSEIRNNWYHTFCWYYNVYNLGSFRMLI